VIFSSVLGHGKTTVVDGVHVSLSRYFVGGIIAMSIITAAYAGLAGGGARRRSRPPSSSAVRRWPRS
jgi:hypothetical protein